MLLAAAPLSFGCHRGGAESPASDGGGDDSAAAAARTDRSDAASDVSGVPPPPDVAAAPPNAARTRSGLATLVLAPGNGQVLPLGFDLVRFRFVGWTKEGNMFGTSSPDPKGPPWTARVNESTIPGLAEGMKLMVAGETRRMWIPAAIAAKTEPLQDLVMDVELVEIVPTPPPPPVPDDAARPSASARETHSGLRWRLVSSGPKTAPKAEPDRIAVYNFTTWTRAGEMLNSSFPNGRPEATLVSDLPPPWNEALQLMKVGDTLRMWFAQNQGAPPGGPYVADVELLYVYSLERRR
jgi:FKBP-type peptidyl-prolyl cis-trans isomerase